MKARLVAMTFVVLAVGMVTAGDPPQPLPDLNITADGDRVHVQWDGYRAVASKVRFAQAKGILILGGRANRPVELSHDAQRTGETAFDRAQTNLRAQQIEFNLLTREMRVSQSIGSGQ
jgi:hypothetical protein